MISAAIPITTQEIAFSKTLVTSEAITNNACKNNCRETQSALSNCCAPNLEISQGNWIICKDEWEQNVVDQYCNTSQNVNWADSCKCIAQASQMNLITYFAETSANLSRNDAWPLSFAMNKLLSTSFLVNLYV